MANLIKDFLGYLKIGEDDEFDDFLNDEDDNPPKNSRRSEESVKSAPAPVPMAKRSLSSEDSREEKEKHSYKPAERTERTSANKIVPIRTTPKGLEVCIMKPSSFEDSQDICDLLLTGRAVVVNLEGFDPMDAQRIMDFISGAVYAINGKLHQISKFIFIFSPDTIDISGDYLGFIVDDSFEVPNLNKDF